jgi:hypothetical protein
MELRKDLRLLSTVVAVMIAGSYSSSAVYAAAGQSGNTGVGNKSIASHEFSP